MKERAADGASRVAFAFASKRNEVLLIAGDKSGGSEQQFYKQLIKKVDQLFDEHLKQSKDG